MSAVVLSPSISHFSCRRPFTCFFPANNGGTFLYRRDSWCSESGRRSRSYSCSSGEPLVTPADEVEHAEKAQNLTADSINSNGKIVEEQAKGHVSSNNLMDKLKRYGVAGVLSYGLLNTFYYLVTFLVVWFYVAPAPSGLGFTAAVERFLKIMAMVWAGSQVTKLLRAGGALALAPLVDKGLSWFTNQFKFESKGKAFAVIVGLCCGLGLLVFLVITVLWA